MSAILPTLWKPGKLVRDTLILGTGLGLRALSQALVFLTIARILGSEGYGAFSAALAVAGVWVNFCGLGGHVILMRDVARDPERFSHSWALALAALGLGMVPVMLLYLASAWWLLESIPWSLILPLGLGELIFLPFVNAAVCAYQGFERMGRSARMILAPVLARLAAAVILAGMVFWYPAVVPLTLWGWLYAGASLLTAIYVHYRVHRDLGRPVWTSRGKLGPYLASGLPFSFLGGAHKLYVDADKFLLARLTSLDVTGVYSAGYRFVDLAFLPLHALISAAAPRLFRAGSRGTGHALRASLPLLWPSLLYALAVGIGLSLAAPLIPYLLGQSYEVAVIVVRWLAWLPLVNLPRLLLQRSLVTSDAQVLGMITVLAGALVNIVLTVWWIPRWGWQGAAAATYVAEVLMVLILLGMIALRIRKV